MVEENNLKDVLDYIDNGITDNNNKTHYILYISLIQLFFEPRRNRFWNTI